MEDLLTKKGMKFLVLLVGVFVWVSFVSAVPQTFNVQGKLTNSAGTALSGNYVMNFSVYDDYTGGNILWTSENQTVSVDTNGVYNILLNNIDLSFSEQYYLGIRVESDDEMSPRINLTSSPYSFRTNAAENITSDNDVYVIVGGVTRVFIASSSGNVGIGTIAPTHRLNVNGTGNFTGSIFINSGTNISEWETNVSINYTDITFDAYDTRWNDELTESDPAWQGNYSIFVGLIQNESYLSTYNATYAGYATNVSLNYTDLTFDAYDTRWNDELTETDPAWHPGFPGYHPARRRTSGRYWDSRP